MLQALNGVQKLEGILLIEVRNKSILDYRISLKTDMRVEIFILVESEVFNKSKIESHLSLNDNRFNEIELNVITVREKSTTRSISMFSLTNTQVQILKLTWDLFGDLIRYLVRKSTSLHLKVLVML